MDPMGLEEWPAERVLHVHRLHLEEETLKTRSNEMQRQQKTHAETWRFPAAHCREGYMASETTEDQEGAQGRHSTKTVRWHGRQGGRGRREICRLNRGQEGGTRWRMAGKATSK